MDSSRSGRRSRAGRRICSWRLTRRRALDSAAVPPRALETSLRTALLGVALALAVIPLADRARAQAQTEPSRVTPLGVVQEVALASGTASRAPHVPRPASHDWISHFAVGPTARGLPDARRRGSENGTRDHASSLLRWCLAHSTSSGVD
jgi:hypothetical protein